MRRTLLVVALVLAQVVTAGASKAFLRRDGAPADAYLNPYGDGEEDPEEEEPKPRWEPAVPWALWFPPPARQALVGGPTFRQQQFRTELGAAVAYVNRQLPLHPFQVGVETTWARFKNREPDDQEWVCCAERAVGDGRGRDGGARGGGKPAMSGAAWGGALWGKYCAAAN